MSRRRKVLNINDKELEKWCIVGVGLIAVLVYLKENHLLDELFEIIFIIAIASFAIYHFSKKEIEKSNVALEEIDKMSGIEFEEYLARYFISKGYKTRMTPKTNDYGADLVLKKNHTKYVVQAKRYSKPVGKSAIYEVVGSKKYYHAEKAMVITSNYFTKSAITLARVNNVELWDRNKIASI